MIFVMFTLFLIHYFTKTSTKTSRPKTKPKLNFQKGFAFFNSMNWKATNANLTADNPRIRLAAKAENEIEFEIEFEIKAVVMVNTINNPYVNTSDFFIS